VGVIISEYLDMRKVSAKWIPKCLNADQKRTRVQMSQESLQKFQNPGEFLRSLVTEDETGLHHYDPETKQQSTEWRHSGSPRPKKFRSQRSAGKVLASVFWDKDGVILIKYLKTGETINAGVYSNYLIELKEVLKKKRRGKVSSGVQFLQDNAPSHKAHQTMQLLVDLGFTCVPHPPYSPDLAPSDYHLFPHLKKHLKGTHFPSDEALIAEVEGWFAQQDKTFYLQGLEMLQHRCEKCIELRGEYVE